MIRASDLSGRAVLELESGRRVGHVADLILDLDEGRVAALVVAEGPALLGRREERVVPATDVHAVGPDAVTVRGGVPGSPPPASLPRFGELKGEKVVTDAGRELGALDDLMIDETDRRIVHYLLGRTGVAGLLGKRGRRRPVHLPGDTDLRVGAEFIVVPDAAPVGAEAPETPDPIAIPARTMGDGGEDRPAAGTGPAVDDRPSPPDAERDLEEARRRLRDASQP